MKTVKMLLGAVAMLAGFAAWGSWVYDYEDGSSLSYDNGNAIMRTDEDADLWQYKVTIDDLVSEPYSIWRSFGANYTLPQPSSTMSGRVWGGWTLSDACHPGTRRLASGAKYEICGLTKLTGIWTVPSIKTAPKPKVKIASTGLSISWSKISGASYYKIRRGTSKTFSKSKVIEQVSGTRYNDEYPERYPKTKFYYWIVPYNTAGKGKSDSSKYAYGSAKMKSLSISPKIPYDNNYNQDVYVGDKIGFSARRNGYSFSASQCKWRVVSGASYASISKKGVLTAKKKGKAVVSASYGGKTVKKTVTIKAHSSVDAGIFKSMSYNLNWHDTTSDYIYFDKSGNDYVLSTQWPKEKNRIEQTFFGAGGIISVSGMLEQRYFSGKGRLGSWVRTEEAGVWNTTAEFTIDVRDEFGAWIDSHTLSLTFKGYKVYSKPWSFSLIDGRIYAD